MQQAVLGHSPVAPICAPANIDMLPTRRAVFGGAAALALALAVPATLAVAQWGTHDAATWLDDWYALGNGSRYDPKDGSVTLLTRLDRMTDVEISNRMRADLVDHSDRLEAVRGVLRTRHALTGGPRP